LSNPSRSRATYKWAELMRRTFDIDVMRCPRCGPPSRFALWRDHRFSRSKSKITPKPGVGGWRRRTRRISQQPFLPALRRGKKSSTSTQTNRPNQSLLEQTVTGVGVVHPVASFAGQGR
jgi:hypothetical protein